MTHVFVGAGAGGGAIGGLLAHAGNVDVLLVSRSDHVRSIRTSGLTVRRPDASFTVPFDVIFGPERIELNVDDAMVLTTKTQHAADALADWADVPVRDGRGQIVGRASDLLPTLIASNGVTSEPIALRYFTRVFAGCVWLPAVMTDPGDVIVRGAALHGVLHVGRYPSSAANTTTDTERLEGVAKHWTAACCLVRHLDGVMAWKYRELLANLGNVLLALQGDASDVVDIQQADGHEPHTVLRAANIAVVSDQEPQNAWRPPGLSFSTAPQEFAQLGGSTWQSLVRSIGTADTDFLNGEILLIAHQHSQSAPVSAPLTALARHAARERQQSRKLSADELRALLHDTQGVHEISDLP